MELPKTNACAFFGSKNAMSAPTPSTPIPLRNLLFLKSRTDASEPEALFLCIAPVFPPLLMMLSRFLCVICLFCFITLALLQGMSDLIFVVPFPPYHHEQRYNNGQK